MITRCHETLSESVYFVINCDYGNINNHNYNIVRLKNHTKIKIYLSSISFNFIDL